MNFMYRIIESQCGLAKRDITGVSLPNRLGLVSWKRGEEDAVYFYIRYLDSNRLNGTGSSQKLVFQMTSNIEDVIARNLPPKDLGTYNKLEVTPHNSMLDFLATYFVNTEAKNVNAIAGLSGVVASIYQDVIEINSMVRGYTPHQPASVGPKSRTIKMLEPTEF